MELWKAALLGLVQGLTEFLPISSDGHLVILERWLGTRQAGSGAAFEACLHAGTLLTCLVAFRADLLAMARVLLQPRRLLRPAADDELGRDARFVLLGTIATVATAIPTADWLASFYDVKWAVVGSMVATGVLLVASRFLIATPERRTAWWQPVVVGTLQTLAILPGLSRSCTTVVAGLAVGLGAPRVARLSFLLSVPIVAAAAGREFWIHRPSSELLLPLAVGVAVAFAVGLFAVRWMLRLVPRGRMHWFAPWMFALAFLVAWTWKD